MKLQQQRDHMMACDMQYLYQIWGLVICSDDRAQHEIPHIYHIAGTQSETDFKRIVIVNCLLAC